MPKPTQETAASGHGLSGYSLLQWRPEGPTGDHGPSRCTRHLSFVAGDVVPSLPDAFKPLNQENSLHGYFVVVMVMRRKSAAPAKKLQN
ncbi:hypothetical protein BaRGS_00020044 [Batillaria attramentaria]|uniref:Uncharacterized protein n=1 Tax=Batillaria attramentaria TaxID=370345 RepID=A0ABD0KNH5_9CAEN